jgi:hypothetical protein
MSLKVIINFEDTYQPIHIEPDFSEMSFISPQKDGSSTELLVFIKPHPDAELPNVYNLGFGPPNGEGSFHDDIKLRHADNSKVFSTVLFHALYFYRKTRISPLD